ncbi:MAG TPA: hypothetical protein VFS44_11030 [Gemmatimonadaceae bacterium]|nr:hypothetical protein [Gemmatimonadaceae bacterium]
MTDSAGSLEQRVAALERALASARDELEGVMAQRQRHRVRPGRLAAMVLVMAVGTVVVGAAGRGGERRAMQEPQVVTVRAPFKVVDEAGKTILEVNTQGVQRFLKVRSAEGNVIGALGILENESGLYVANQAAEPVALIGDIGLAAEGSLHEGAFVAVNGRPTAAIASTPEGDGYVAAWSRDGGAAALLRAEKSRAGYFLEENGKPSIELGRLAAGNHALKIRDKANVVAGIGETIDGSGGGMLLRNSAGVTTITAGNAEGDGQVVVRGGGGGQAGIATKGAFGTVFAGPIGAPEAELAQSQAHPGAGVLALTLGGASVVQAGYDGQGGIVEAYGQGKPVAVLKPGVKLPGAP